MASLRLSASLGFAATRPAPVRLGKSLTRSIAPQNASAPQRGIAPARGIPVSGPSAPVSPEPTGAKAGQITKELVDGMRAKIGEALETKDVKIEDVYGDGRHVAIDVISPLFEGKSAVARQRMVYKAIWFELQEAVHAVDAMTTKTPQEAGVQ